MTATNENTQKRQPQPQNGKQQQQKQQQRQQDYSRTNKNNKNSNNNNYILQDSAGHVNGELAERIWNWEQELRQKRSLPQVEYSIRNGLRLVDQIVQEIIVQQQNQRNNRDDDNDDSDNDNITNSALYADLIQEGLSALLDAMSHYRADHYQQDNGDDDSDSGVRSISSSSISSSTPISSSSTPSSRDGDFEAYAEQEIRAHLAFVLNQQDDVSRYRAAAVPPLPRLPQSIRNVLKRAKQVAAALTRESADGHLKPTLAAIAERMNVMDGGDNNDIMPVEQLRDYLRLATRLSRSRRLRRANQPPLSVESTVKISYDDRPAGPFLQDSLTTTYTDQEEWELRQGLFLNDGHTLHRDELIDEFLDETVEYEGDDEAWIRQQQAQVAGTLQDSIPDNTMEESSSTSPDDLALAEMIRHDVREFLTTTLNDNEHRVVRLVFGLDTGGRQCSMKRVAMDMGISALEVSNLLQVAMRKLRESYLERYGAEDPYLDDDEHGNTVDSV